MGDPFIGEIRLVSFAFPPKGWAPCNGQLLPIASNQALFAVLGTTYGGDGRTTFALPDLRGRVPVGVGGNVTSGQVGGSETVTLTTDQIPSHTHAVAVSSQRASVDDPAGGYWAATGDAGYAPTPNTAMAALVSPAGGTPHENRQPSLTLTYVIALVGIFPPRT
jgi:microcystin-dependent protein